MLKITRTLFDSLKKLVLPKMVEVTQQFVNTCLDMTKV